MRCETPKNYRDSFFYYYDSLKLLLDPAGEAIMLLCDFPNSDSFLKALVASQMYRLACNLDLSCPAIPKPVP